MFGAHLQDLFGMIDVHYSFLLPLALLYKPSCGMICKAASLISTCGWMLLVSEECSNSLDTSSKRLQSLRGLLTYVPSLMLVL